jgi:enediyne polyketide synthase
VSGDRLLLLGAADADGLERELWDLRRTAEGASPSELAQRNRQVAEAGTARAGVVASDADELSERLERLGDWLGAGELETGNLRVGRGLVLGSAEGTPRVGFLFPGQGAPVLSQPGFLAERFAAVREVYEQAGPLERDGDVPPELVQLATVTASLAGLRALESLGIEADFTVGHSVGELTALHWAGSLDTEAVLRIARARGEAMTKHALAEGAMASVEADAETFERVLDGADVSIACFNSPRHRVVSGTMGAVDAVVARAWEVEGAGATRLHVVGAFHSPLMRDAVPVFERYLAGEELGAPNKAVFSTISGAALEADADLRDLLVHQISEPVRFVEAVDAAGPAQLLLEVGPGRMLSGLVREFAPAPVLPLRVGHSSPQAFLTAVGAAYAVGATIRPESLAPNGD